MEILIAIITIVWSILGIILFFKIWGMTNNVKEMHDWLMEAKLNKLHFDTEIPPRFIPPSEKDFEKLPEETISKIPHNGSLKKGDKVSIAEYGICTFEGMWEGKYAFYPEIKMDLPSSPYLINDVEPYLLIPKNKINSFIK